MLLKNHHELDSTEASLRQALAQLHHELRHVRDGLERNGVSPGLEQRARQLSANINLCEIELERILGQQALVDKY
jgi:hypothetical protein